MSRKFPGNWFCETKKIRQKKFRCKASGQIHGPALPGLVGGIAAWLDERPPIARHVNCHR